MKNYRLEDGCKIYMEFGKSLNDDLIAYITESLDTFKYESDTMFEGVIDEILNAVRDDCRDWSREGVEKYTLQYIKKNYPYNYILPGNTNQK